MQASNAPNRAIDEWASYRRLLRYMRPYRFRLWTGVVFGVLFAGSTFGLLPVLRGNFSHMLGGADSEAHSFLFFVVLIPLLTLVRGVGQYFSTYLIQWVGNRVVTDLRIAAFSHLQNLPVAYYDRSRTGEMISRTVNDTTLLEKSVSESVGDMAKQPFLVVSVVAYLFKLEWRLALAGLVALPLCMIPILLYGRKVRKAGREGQERLADVVSIMHEAVVGVRIVKAFCMEQHELNRFSAQCRAFMGRIMRVVRSSAIVQPIVALISAIAGALSFLYARHIGMGLADIITFCIGLFMLYDPVKSLSKLNMVIQHSSGAADRIFEVLDTESSVKDRPGAVDLEGPIESIVFDRVSFSYGQAPVLEDINLRIRSGERVAIVGGSGAGKTTLVNLLPRFFDATGGAITLNGRDVRDVNVRSLRRRIGLVTQETFLFNDTVARNIAYGNFDASREAIEGAARRAHAHEFITGLEQGYETVLGERGDRLSGGQRQRIAIARAILGNPAILILDEATSALDTESERLVQKALNEVMEGRTVFAIAHRLSTITRCDRIIVLERGRIAEQGSHGDLLAMNGLYRRLYDLQFEMSREGR